jgi:hypothetical protein
MPITDNVLSTEVAASVTSSLMPSTASLRLGWVDSHRADANQAAAAV